MAIPLETKIIHADHLFTALPNPVKFWQVKPGYEEIWEWPGELGKGALSLLKLKPGLMLGIGNYRLRENLSVNFELNRVPFIVMGFIISADTRVAIDTLQEKKGIITNTPGHGFISYHRHQQGIAEYPAQKKICNVGVYIDPLLLKKFTRGRHDLIPGKLHHCINGSGGTYYQFVSQTLSVNMALQQIMNCPYKNQLKYMYLESKALELVTHTLAQLALSGKKGAGPCALKSDDVERIRKARDRLTCDLVNPPTLMDLARQAGINKNKLNQGFRRVFGTSVFDYLRIYRLEQARKLLETRTKNVTEVAFEVGYAHQSNFTTAFKKHFGTNPADHLR